MGLNSINLDNINLDVNNFDEDDPAIILHSLLGVIDLNNIKYAKNDRRRSNVYSMTSNESVELV